MQILLSITLFFFFSMGIREMRQHRDFYNMRQIIDNFGNNLDSAQNKSFSVGIMANIKAQFMLTTKNMLKNTVRFLYTVCISFLILFFPISFSDFAEANSPVAIDPSIKSGQYSQEIPSGVWRLRIFDAAIVHGNTVLLGEIAEPLGDISARKWEELAKKPLWAAPNQVGRPFQINKKRLQSVLRQHIGMYADSCILPNSLAIQKGGAVIREEDLRRIILQRLSAQINALGGHSDLTDYRLPSYIFVSHASQNLILEPSEVKAGRINVRFGIQEIDGSVVQRFSGSVFLNLWVDAPALVRPMAKGDAILPTDITYKSVNLAFENGALWDGRGGPWQLVRSVGAFQPLAASDLQPLAAVHRGDKVRLLYDKGNIRLKVMAEAMEDGGVGDLILVRNLDSKRQIYGMVKDKHTVISK